MREIIFRAWDGKKLSIGKAEYFDDSVNFRFEHFDIDCDKPILEQYTGLKDKNGKMIFEGDVVRIEDFVNATVKWREDIACWTLQSYIIGNTWGSSMLEVIGTIHDQKEG